MEGDTTGSRSPARRRRGVHRCLRRPPPPRRNSTAGVKKSQNRWFFLTGRQFDNSRTPPDFVAKVANWQVKHYAAVAPSAAVATIDAVAFDVVIGPPSCLSLRIPALSSRACGGADRMDPFCSTAATCFGVQLPSARLAAQPRAAMRFRFHMRYFRRMSMRLWPDIGSATIVLAALVGGAWAQTGSKPAAAGRLETRRPEGRPLHEGQAPRDARTGRPGAEGERFAVGHHLDVRQARPRRAVRQWRLLRRRPGRGRQD